MMSDENAAATRIAVALYDYEATDGDELTISENDNLMVLDDSDPDWVKVRLISKNGGGEGMVPRTYIEIKEPGVTHEPPPAEVI